MELQDRHSEEVTRLMLNSPEEAAAIRGHSETRSRLASEITARAYEAAAAKIARDQELQQVKETVTGVTRFVSIGSTMQQETKATTRGADRERALAQARLDEIESRLKNPEITHAEREILRDMRAVSEAQMVGAEVMLADNKRLTALGYSLDAVTTLSGSKAVMVGGAIVRKTFGALGTTLGKRAAATEATGLASKATISVVDDAANASATSIAGRRALAEGDLTRIVGTDLLPVPPAPQVAMEFTRSELRRLFTPGVNLTGAEIVKKAELLRRMHAARIGMEQAFRNGAAESVMAPLRAEYLRLKSLVDQAQVR
jgi:hypothetical protein